MSNDKQMAHDVITEVEERKAILDRVETSSVKSSEFISSMFTSGLGIYISGTSYGN